MLIFVGSRRQTAVLRTLKRDGRMPDWICRTYSWLFRTPRLPAGTYIFTGVDRLDAGERRMAGRFYRHLNALGPGFRALNDPARGMNRYRLLRTLFEAGINDFNAYLVAEVARPERYPVFIRRNLSSIPPLTDLIETRADLDAQIDRLLAAGEYDEDLLIIEFNAEPIAPGLFRKQAEYRVADRLVANSSIYSPGWYVKWKYRVVVDDAYYKWDTRVIDENRFAEPTRRAFELANIEYGRADIGLIGDRVQIYEINFNPDLRTQRERPHPDPLHRANWERSDTMMLEAMSAVDTRGKGSAATLSDDELVAFRLRFWRNYAPQRY